MNKTVAAVFAALLLLAGCGDSGPSTDAPAGTDQPAPTATATAPASEGVVVDITIADGKVTPQGKRIDVEVGEPITLLVTSDEADEIHVHSDPEHSLDVVAGDVAKELTFVVDTPGQVAVESHHLHATIVQLVVTP